MTDAAVELFATPADLPESPDPVAASAAAYANEVVELLSELLLGLVRARAPELEPVLRGEQQAVDLSPELMEELERRIKEKVHPIENKKVLEESEA